jgi:stage III sporulation protein AB
VNRLLVKLAGAILILASTSYLGWQISGRYARRPMQLRDAQIALAVLETEVGYATPLPAALLSAAATATPPVASILATLGARLVVGDGISTGEAMRLTLSTLGETTAFTREDLDVLASLGGVLGVSGRADQIRHLALAQDRLRALEARAQDERNRYERVARYLGVLSGAALVLIFL